MDIYTISGKYNLTLIDKFSKFAWAYVVTNRNSICIIKTFKNVVELFGIPKKLVYDQGPEFSGEVFKKF